MRILITGGAGFIGSHLSDRLLAEGHHVVCLDNFFTGRRDNIDHLLDHGGFELIRHDVCEPMFVEVDQIYNLACPASPVHYQYNPVKTIKSNVMGTLNMLVLAKRVGARILQASTSEVYGDPVVHPQPESYWGNVNPIGPRACYDEGKRVRRDAHVGLPPRGRGRHPHRPDLQHLRPPHGGERRPGGLQLHRPGAPRAGADDVRHGEQTRSFCYVDDLVDGLVRLMAAEGRHDPVNLGNPVEFTIRQLAEQVVKVAGGETRVTFKPLPQDDPTQRQPDITRAREWLGWEPRLQLEAGLVRTVEYFRHRLKRRNRASAPKLDVRLTSPGLLD